MCRGSHNTYDLEEIFVNSSREDLLGIVERYNMEFRICGYEETMEKLRGISDR